jgi:hypothetical protein
MHPILFIFGPSGAGKSTLGDWVAMDFGFLHIEIDRYPDGDGIDLSNLRIHWDEFYLRGSAKSLAHELRSRAVAGGWAGTILTFPGTVFLPKSRIQTAAKDGIVVVILYGTGAECLNSFLAREKKSRRNLTVDHWILNNQVCYAHFSRPEFTPYRVLAFHNGRFRSRAMLLRELRSLLVFHNRQDE